MSVPIDMGSHLYGTIGLHCVSEKGFSAGIEYTRQVDRNYNQDLWSLRLNVPF